MDSRRAKSKANGARASVHHEESIGDERSGTVSPPSPSSSIHTSPPPLPHRFQQARRMTHHTNASSVTSLSVTVPTPPPPYHHQHGTLHRSDTSRRMKPGAPEQTDRQPELMPEHASESGEQDCMPSSPPPPPVPSPPRPKPGPSLPQLREPLLKPQLPQLVDRTHFRVLHPHGFRLLHDRSVIERSLRGYFRLPPAPSEHLQTERDRLRRTLRYMAQEERQKLVATLGAETTVESGVVLDGFLLLSAAAKADPAEAESVTLQASHLVDTVAEDLTYFTNLFFLDVSENALRLEDMLPLTALETLHMAYNQIASLQGLRSAVEEHRSNVLPTTASASADGGGLLGDTTAASTNGAASRSSIAHDVVFPNMLALNLSYNVIPYHDITLLAHLPCLEKLDLSGNRLRRLPADLSTLSSVTHFALEGNLFTSHCVRGVHDDPVPDVFLSLATMPSLVEVNLNHNRLSYVPPLSVNDGSGLCFPCIETIGVSDNLFHTPQSLLPLAALHRTLRRVVLTDNPLARHALDVRRARMLFDHDVVDAYYERTTKDDLNASASASAPPSSSRQPYEEPAAEPSLHIGGDTGGVRPPSSTDLSWQGEEWCRLIPCRGDDGGEGDECETNTRTRTLDVSAAAAAAAAAAVREAVDGETVLQTMTARRGDRADDREAFVTSHSTDKCDGDDRHALRLTGHSSIRNLFATAEDYLQHHRIELVVHAAAMPRRGLRYFYATQIHVAGRSTLVSLPPYTEFMDIYQLVRGQARPRRAHEPSHARAKDFDDVRVELPAELRTPVTEPPTAQEMSSASSVDLAAAAADHSGTSFFITGTDVATATRQARARLPRGERASGHAGSTAVTSISDATSNTAKLLPKSVVSPVTLNVHSAVTELRAMLRKPLPALPFPVTHALPAHR